MTVEPTRLTDEQFSNLSRILAGEALLRIEEMRGELQQVATKLMTESTENELRLELEHERNLVQDQRELLEQLRADNKDLLKRLTLLSPKSKS